MGCGVRLEDEDVESCCSGHSCGGIVVNPFERSVDKCFVPCVCRGGDCS